MCPNFFDETVACDHHDVTKKDVLARGMKWSEEPQGSGKEFYYTPLPISQYDESVVGPDQARANIEACLKGKHLCESSKKEFRITKQELAFYIDNHVDIPIQAFRPRLAARLARVNTHELHDRMC